MSIGSAFGPIPLPPLVTLRTMPAPFIRERISAVGWSTLFALACALAMDAFAVAIATGLTLSPLRGPQVLRMAAAFGLFQGLMPVIGWAAGRAVYAHIAAFDHWIAFGLLALIGGKMVWGALRQTPEEDPRAGDPTTGLPLLLLALATSIDALAAGISLALVRDSILAPALVIGLVTAGFTATGMALGRRIGALWGPRVEVLGGLVLISLGVKIVLEHTVWATG